MRVAAVRGRDLIRRGDVVVVEGEPYVFNVWAIEGPFAWLRCDVRWCNTLMVVETEACRRVVNLFVDWIGWEIN